MIQRRATIAWGLIILAAGSFALGCAAKKEPENNTSAPLTGLNMVGDHSPGHSNTVLIRIRPPNELRLQYFVVTATGTAMSNPNQPIGEGRSLITAGHIFDKAQEVYGNNYRVCLTFNSDTTQEFCEFISDLTIARPETNGTPTCYVPFRQTVDPSVSDFAWIRWPQRWNDLGQKELKNVRLSHLPPRITQPTSQIYTIGGATIDGVPTIDSDPKHATVTRQIWLSGVYDDVASTLVSAQSPTPFRYRINDHGLIDLEPQVASICDHGDSGGPVYQRSTQDEMILYAINIDFVVLPLAPMVTTPPFPRLSAIDNLSVAQTFTTEAVVRQNLQAWFVPDPSNPHQDQDTRDFGAFAISTLNAAGNQNHPALDSLYAVRQHYLRIDTAPRADGQQPLGKWLHELIVKCDG